MQICRIYDLDKRGEWKTVVQAQYYALNGKCKDDWGGLTNDICNWATNE